jgi:hypothetical protein
LVKYEGFLPLVQGAWTQSIHYADAAKRIAAKFKIFAKILRHGPESYHPLRKI